MAGLMSSIIRGIGRFAVSLLPRRAYLVIKGPLKGARFVLGSLSGAGGGASVYLNQVETDQTAAIARELHAGMTFYDVGANVGYYTILASRLVGPSGQVTAFEPLIRNLSYLHRHKELNSAENVRILPFAVSNRSGTATFSVGNVSAMGKIDDAGEILVPTITLDEAANLLDILPQVIKIDVEGAEFEVLQGSKDLLSSAEPIIFLSTHSTILREKCLRLLTDGGYTVEPLDDIDDPHEFLAKPLREGE
jgi:FkbM family methyltransferase